MALEPIEQLKQILEKVERPLLLLPENPDGDAIASAWAFAYYLKKKNVTPTVAFSDPFDQQKKYTFLEAPEEITSSLTGTRDFVLIFNTKYNKISNVRTDEATDELRIYLTPDKASIDPRDFSFMPAQSKYDLIVMFGCPDKESLGKIYEENADMFYEVPIVNIDCHSNNDSYGQINIVEVVASSVSEVLANIFDVLDVKVVDEAIAQCLLTGIISATDSYQRKNTTPKSLHLSARLIEQGADQQAIVRYLYKTQPFNVLKLWGRIMAKLQWDESTGFVWAKVTLEDFIQSRTSPKDLAEILDKIHRNYSAGKVFMILYQEKAQATAGIIKATNDEILKRLAQLYQGNIRGSYMEFSMQDETLQEAETRILSTLTKPKKTK